MLALSTAALLAAGMFQTRPGVAWPLVATVALAAVVLARAAGRARPRSADAWGFGQAVIAVLLLGVPAVTDSIPMIVLCVLTALGLAGSAVLTPGAHRPLTVLAGLVLLPVAWARSLPWLAAARGRVRGGPQVGAWVRAVLVAAVLGGIVGGLLVSADAAFSGLMLRLVPQLDPDRLLTGAVIATVVGSLTAAWMFAAAAPLTRTTARTRRPRPTVEWAVPLGVVATLIFAFLLVQAAVLFDAYPQDLVTGDLTPAERARQGFGQLVAVTVVVSLALGWAAASAGAAPQSGQPPAGRTWLLGLGGLLLVQVLVLVGSALRRMSLYERAFGATVLRLEVAVFEVWVGVALLVAAGLWWRGRGRWALPVTVSSAAVVLLVLAVASPERIVATHNVTRASQTGVFDLDYHARLSADAVPALDRLPEPLRSCALAGHRAPDPDPWYGTNLARLRAAAVVMDRPVGACR